MYLQPDPELQQMAGDYLRIVTVFSFGLFLSISFERMMQATGNTMLSMTTPADRRGHQHHSGPDHDLWPAGLPQMGVAGAAAATVIGQIGGMLLGFVLNQLKNHELKVVWRGFRPEASVFKSILAVGFPSIIMQSISSFMNVFMNLILIAYGNTAVSVLGVYFKLQSFVFMPVFGWANGLVAIVATTTARACASVYTTRSA